jgi:hypothetical protein
VSGRVYFSQLENNALPAALPAGYTYSSAFSLNILQNQMPIPMITEGGYIKTSFVAPVLPEGSSYSILFWDNGIWLPLQEFRLDKNGNA